VYEVPLKGKLNPIFIFLNASSPAFQFVVAVSNTVEDTKLFVRYCKGAEKTILLKKNKKKVIFTYLTMT